MVKLDVPSKKEVIPIKTVENNTCEEILFLACPCVIQRFSS
jgi:hypothetical protein